jgi:hypothetical protein
VLLQVANQHFKSKPQNVGDLMVDILDTKPIGCQIRRISFTRDRMSDGRIYFTRDQ